MFAECFQHLGEIERRRIATPPNVRMRLNRLERPAPWDEALQDEIRATMPVAKIQQYPDYPPFYEQLSEFVGVPVDRLVVGAGIEEFARSLFMLCGDPGQQVAVCPWPSCAMFEIYAKAFGLEFVPMCVDPNDGEFPRIAAATQSGRLRLVWLVNPGQPVETCIGIVGLKYIAMWCERTGSILAIDEAYHGFGAPTALPLVEEFENVVVLRTFSKAFGAAGIRLGYAIAGPKIHKALDAVRQSGEVSNLSMHVASVLMRRYDEFVKPGIEAICEGRDWLREAAQSELGLRAWGQYANHVLIEVSHVRTIFADGISLRVDDATSVANALAERGIYVKAGYPPPVDRHILVTCGPRPLMEEFFGELKEVLR